MSTILEPALKLALDPNTEPDDYWAAVAEVQKRDFTQVLEALRPLAESEDAEERSFVGDVLRLPLRHPAPEAEQSVELLREILESEESDPAVLDAVAAAFTELKHPAVVELILPITFHEIPELRLTALQGLLQAIEQEQVMSRFLALTADPDAELRSWTLFALSALLEARPKHGQALKDVFVRGLLDANLEVKAEAALGLARCLDRRAIDAICIGLRIKAPLEQYKEAARFLIEKGIGADVLRRALSKI